MSKPILVVKVPHIEYDQYYKIANSLLNHVELNEDYHILPLLNGEVEEITFECFNSPYKEEELTELRQLIDKINKEYEHTR